MTGIARDLELCWPCLVEFPGGHRWRDGIVAALNDHAWNIEQPVRVRNELAFLEEGAMDKIVRFYSRKCEQLRVIGRVRGCGRNVMISSSQAHQALAAGISTARSPLIRRA